MVNKEKRKNKLLLLMTPNMSLEKWNSLGQLSREIWLYQELCREANMELIIYSYGRNDSTLYDFPNVTVLSMHSWIPSYLPFKLQNILYNLCSLVLFRNYFKTVKLTKTNQFSASGFGLLIKLVFGIPLLIRMGYYNTHLKKSSLMSKFKEYIFFKSCDSILSTSLEASNYIRYTYNIPQTKINVILNSINLKLFKPVQTSKVYDVIFVGRFEKVKNIELLVSVIELLNLRVLVIGKGGLSPLIKKLADNNNLVQWIERIDNTDLPMLYSKSKIFLIVSFFEGNPKALLEAMACGIPAIGVNAPGVRECIIHKHSGLLIEADKHKIVTEIIALSNDPNRLVLLGSNAREWVLEQSDISKNVVKEVEIYSHLTQNA